MQAFNRNIRDAALSVTKAVPTSAGNVTSDTIDLGSLATDMLPEDIVVEVIVPAIAGHTTTGSLLTVELYVGTTTTVAAATAPLPLVKCVVAGVAVSGNVETIFRYKLPPGCPRYIGWNILVGATDTYSGTATFSLLF